MSLISATDDSQATIHKLQSTNNTQLPCLVHDFLPRIAPKHGTQFAGLFVVLRVEKKNRADQNLRKRRSTVSGYRRSRRLLYHCFIAAWLEIISLAYCARFHCRNKRVVCASSGRRCSL